MKIELGPALYIMNILLYLHGAAGRYLTAGEEGRALTGTPKHDNADYWQAFTGTSRSD